MKVGKRVVCIVCGRMKKPKGRSAPAGAHLCEPTFSTEDRGGCSGYDLQPLVGVLWPGETEEEYGYPAGPNGWVEVPND